MKKAAQTTALLSALAAAALISGMIFFSTSDTMRTVLECFALALIVAQAFIFRAKILAPAERLQRACQSLLHTSGDNTERVESTIEGIEAMLGLFDNSVTGMASMADHLTHAGEEISASANNLAEQSQLQTTQTQVAASAMGSMASTIDETNTAATNVSAATQALSVCMNGVSDVTQQAALSMRKSQESTTALSDLVAGMKSSIDGISNIVGVIKDIANQTNLLALNAAIEAARAGEHGRGFAVVADEVRKLANNTVKATADITDQIHTIQDKATSTVVVMEQTSNEIALAHETLDRTSVDIEKAHQQVNEITQQVDSISMYMSMQSAVTSTLSTANNDCSTLSEQMERQTQEILALLEGMVKANNELSISITNFSEGTKAPSPNTM